MIHEIKKPDESLEVKQTLQEMLDRADEFKGIICIALNKDDSQFLMSSLMNGYEKSFLISFANSWLNKYFERLEEK